MPQIVHIAVKVEDLDKASEFYEKALVSNRLKPQKGEITPRGTGPTEGSTWPG